MLCHHCSRFRSRKSFTTSFTQPGFFRMDRLDKKRRSWNMGRIKGRDTAPEIAVRSLLHREGYRFRLNRKDLPGRPDIVLPGRNAVVFVHGCFWHRHCGCKFCYTPKSNKEFWQAKFAGNVERDRKNMQDLKKLGWHVIVVWECELSSPDKLQKRLRKLLTTSP
jgi:DNA mismatch endonuclease, patch repair protein